MNKSLARKRGLAARAAISEEQRRKDNASLFQKMKELAGSYHKIGCYVSMKKEADTLAFLQWCFDQGKSVSVPLVKGDTLEFHEISSFDSLSEGRFGVQEPFEGSVTAKEDIDLMFVPLSSFDQRNNRTGYGKGYYDSVLLPSMHKCGIAYAEQEMESIEAEPCDVQLDQVLIP
jgi:5-formyltetrahydrofolate cyclo-ligase